MALNRNPRTGRPATLCECGKWNDWHKVAGMAEQNRTKRFDKPAQCVFCFRQLREKYTPNKKRVVPSQVMIDGQRQLFNSKDDSN